MEDFVTALLVDIHPDGRLSLCSAGHHPPMLIPAVGLAVPSGDPAEVGSAVLLKSPSPPLGLAERFIPSAARWDIGDRLLLFTDGLIEARSPDGEFFPLEDHLDVLLDGTPEEALDRLTARVVAHAGGHLRDDLAMLLVERRPLPVEPAVPHQLTADRGPRVKGVARVGGGSKKPAGDGADDADRTGPATGWRRLRAGRTHRPD